MVKIEGPKEGVMGVKRELLKMKRKTEPEYERDIIIESRFHGLIIGKKGKTVSKICQKFDQVEIIFPPKGELKTIGREPRVVMGWPA